MRITITIMLLLTVTTITAKEGLNTSNLQPSRASIFIENSGQITDQFGSIRRDIDFKLTQGNLSVYLGSTALHYQWAEPINKSIQPRSNFNIYRLDVELIGANKHAEVITEGGLDGHENYYGPQCPNGVTVYSYTRIIYKDVYPNIDWELLTQESGLLKYNFIVHKGGNYRDIKLRFSGATSLQLKDGCLFAQTPLGAIRENVPYTYEQETGQVLASTFVLNNAELTYSVKTGPTDKATGTIIIDPTILNLEWSTYFGGSNIDRPWTSTSDISGNAYLSGYTLSTNNVATTGAHQTTLSGSFDGYVAKFSTDGRRLWATYYGGSGLEEFCGIACFSNTDVYLGGYTTSASGIAGGSSVFQSTYNSGSSDAMIIKLDATAGLRQWGTYYGGIDSDVVNSLACDATGNLIVCGSSKSTTNIATTGSNAGFNDGFIAKFTSGGTRIWGRYFGGPATDYLKAVTVDASGYIYAGGLTYSATGISTSGTQQTALAIGTGSDAMIGKWDANGNFLWGTYYGGDNIDEISCMTCDKGGNLYVGGGTQSTNNIASPGAYQTTHYSSDGLFAKFNGNNGTRIWGSYLDVAYIFGMTTDIQDNLFLAGTASDYLGNVVTSDAFKPLRTSGDGIFMKFSPSGARIYGSFFGGNNEDQTTSIAFTSTYKILLFGWTNSTIGLATPNAYQTTYGGASSIYSWGDSYIASFAIDTIPYFPLPYIDTVFCAGDSIHINYGVNTKFNSSNVFTLQMSNAAGSFASPVNIATKASDTAGIFNGKIPISTTGGTGYRFRIVSSSPVRISDRDTLPIHIKPVAAGFSASSNTPICAGDTLRLYGASTTSGLTWNWSGPVSFTSISKDTIIANAQSNRAGDYVLTATLNGCAIRDTETITVKPLPAKPNAGSNTPLCAGSNLNLTATTTTSGVSWSWTGPGSFSSTTQNPVRTSVTTADAGNYIVSAILNGCATKDTEVVVINPIPPTPIGGSNSPLCTGNTLNLTASPVSGASYSWTGPASFSSAIQNPSRTNVQLSHAGIYSVTATVNGCTSPAGTTNVVISAGPSVSIYVNPNDTICTGGNATFVALPTNGGTTPQFKWYRNSSFTGVVTASYPVTAPTNGDVFYCELTNKTTCAVPASSNSNSITLTVLPNVTPSVSVTANPAGPLVPFQLVTFTATPVNGGSTPQYQWTRNGTNVTGAMAASWGATTLSDHDTICVWLTSSEQCPSPKTVKSTNCVTVNILTDVEKISDRNQLTLYPNPNNGTFTVFAGSLTSNIVELEILSSLGQTIGTWNRKAINGELLEIINLPELESGFYLFKIRSGETIRTLGFTINR